jgi:peptidoglycan/LPS O-acetylase OafA/YrhL
MVSFLFLAGALTWELRRRWQAGQKIPAHLDVLAGGFFFAALWFAPQLGAYFSATLFLLATGFLILGLSRTTGVISQLLAWTPIFFLGEISYSIYLTHAITQRVLKIALPVEKFAASSLPMRAGVAFFFFACLLGIALCVYYAVEKPTRKKLRQLNFFPPRNNSTGQT